MRKIRRDGLKWGEGFIEERENRSGGTTYQARWPELGPNGRQRFRARSFPTREDAEDHLREIGRARRSGRYVPASDLTVRDLVEAYIERAASRLTSRTILTYRQRAESMIYPALGHRKAVAVGTMDIQRWIDQLVREAYKPATIHAAIAVVVGAFREATALGITERNVTVGIRRPAIGKRQISVWTQEQARTVLKHLQDDERYDALYRVALATGMRPGELRALRWRDVDLARGVITVRTTITRDTAGSEVFSTTTKTREPRAVAITGALIERLRWHQTRQKARRLAAPTWHDLDIVFDRGDGHWLYQ